MSNITVEVPKATNGETVGLAQAAAALGLTRQAAFHMHVKGTFPCPTVLEGKRVRVKLSDLRKALGLKAGQTSVTVAEAVKRPRTAAAEKSAPAKATATKKAAQWPPTTESVAEHVAKPRTARKATPAKAPAARKNRAERQAELVMTDKGTTLIPKATARKTTARKAAAK
jgi:predicted DNA-binding transcriptional regulator AlpA